MTAQFRLAFVFGCLCGVPLVAALALGLLLALSVRLFPRLSYRQPRWGHLLGALGGVDVHPGPLDDDRAVPVLTDPGDVLPRGRLVIRIPQKSGDRTMSRAESAHQQIG